jgi:Tfp pilus assembly protein PilE
VAISTRVREESGFGLVELLIAMTVMIVGITALVAAMSSGFIAVKRAADESTAAAVADKQMEAYHALPNCAVYLDSTKILGTTSVYKGDSAFTNAQVTTSESLTGSACTASAPSTLIDPEQWLPGPDGRDYMVRTYMAHWRPVTKTNVTRKGSVDKQALLPAGGNTLNDFRVVKDDKSMWTWDGTTWLRVSDSVEKKVTVVVRDPQDAKTLIRESSTFAFPTGCNNTSGPVSKGC